MLHILLCENLKWKGSLFRHSVGVEVAPSTTWVDTKINGHEDKWSLEFFNRVTPVTASWF